MSASCSIFDLHSPSNFYSNFYDENEYEQIRTIIRSNLVMSRKIHTHTHTHREIEANVLIYVYVRYVEIENEDKLNKNKTKIVQRE